MSAVEADIFENNKTPVSATSEFVMHKDDQPVHGGFDPKYGGATWQTLISQDRMNSDELVFGVAHIPAGGMLALHRHEPAEFYYVLSGSGTVFLDGTETPVIRGSVAFIPGNAEHGFLAGPEGVHFAYGFARNSFGDVDYAFSE